MSYDTALTVFSPDGQLFQVEYAMEAVKRGLCCVGVRGKDVIVLGVEKKATSKLQNVKTIKKVYQLDNNLCMTFSGLNADARILANQTRLQCQQYKIYYEDDPSVDYIAKFTSQQQQKFTQRGGARPYGISTLIAGFDNQNKPKLFQTDPSGACSEWKATSLGKSAKQVKDFLEKHWREGLHEKDALLLTTKALMDVVESGNKNIELCVIRKNTCWFLSETEVEELTKITAQIQ
ncbi:unnamed protein product (macronuclear) [Paramecium tetraurelia]|uniref:Proteasome alpha-type subunits domain-containing protein n=1 Tax=Paramecium tetraurelia TaxID=5888 RepID=A0E2W4_PARTE|nr:uncharacterized protein GSPATT00022803001 [Paramecium tetraurelia]CAK89631.1 unnamed protein product [Paramecium tetraurelia]|eukprot:XP_001457028.1 hypothetical protein (macronuclear) [Paramecium tetraurelia strain d4-2]